MTRREYTVKCANREGLGALSLREIAKLIELRSVAS